MKSTPRCTSNPFEIDELEDLVGDDEDCFHPWGEDFWYDEEERHELF